LGGIGGIVDLAAGAAPSFFGYIYDFFVVGIVEGVVSICVGALFGIYWLAPRMDSRAGTSRSDSNALVGLTLGVIGGGIVGISGVLFPFLVVAGGIVIGAWLGKILSGVLFRLSVVLFGIGGQRERAIPALVEPSILDRV